MGGVPKQRHTKSRRNKRRSQIFLNSPSTTICSHCKKPSLPHTICKSCGYYQGKEYLDITKSLEKKRKRRVDKGLEPQENKNEL